MTNLLNERETADRLQVSIGTVRAWRRAGRGPRFVKFANQRRGAVRYRVEDLERFIQDSLRQSTSDTATATA